MSQDAFRPTGPTYFVDENTAVQAASTTITSHQAYRIRNLGPAAAYIAFNTPNVSSGSTPTMAKPVAPTSGTPSGNPSKGQGTIGMLPASVEVFILPANAFFLASAGATFEVLPGEGQ